MAALDGAHLDSMDPVDSAAKERRVDMLDSAAVGAKALGADDQRQSDCVDSKDQRPFLSHDVEQGFDAVRLEPRKHCLVDRGHRSRMTAREGDEGLVRLLETPESPPWWIGPTAPECPRAKAMRSWSASSAAPSRWRRCATARSSK